MKKVFKTYAFKGLVLWVLGGTILVYNLTNRFESNGAFIAVQPEIIVKDGDFEITLSKPISYAPRQSEIRLSKEINSALTTLADHLIEDPLKKLLITGIYTLAEEKDAETKGLGKIRSENVKDLLVSFGADPSSIYTTAKLTNDVNSGSKQFKGVSFSIINKDRKINTNPLLEKQEGKMVSQTAFLLPYYTTQFEDIEALTLELNEFVERIIENPDMAIVLSAQDNEVGNRLVNALLAYIKEMTYGVDVNVIKDLKTDDSLSDRDKQNIRIDIGIKRFQNNLEFLGS